MRTSEARFKALFENALNGIALLSDGMICLDVNPAVCRMLGRERDEIVGRHISAFLTGDSEQILADLDRGLAVSGTWRGSFPVVHISGSELHLDWNIAVHSEPATRLAVTTDTSERKASEAEGERLLASERAARGEAERANGLKDEFLAAVAHDLRTPLNAILGWTSLIAMQNPGGRPEFTSALEAIERNVRAQAQMISDLLDLSNFTAGKVRLELQWFDPAAAIEASLAAFTAAAQAKGITFDVVMAPEVGTILCDQGRFEQVVNTLVDNAIKSSESGGVIRLHATGTATAVGLSIGDSGRGIARDLLPFVFDRFRQEDASIRRRLGGLGLGMTIVKQLIEAHQGSIEVSSAGENQGTTFVVTLPRR